MAKYGMFKYGTQKYGFSKVLPPFIYPRNIKEIEDYPICKVQILDKSENVIDEISSEIISGDTTFTNQFGVRRTANLVLKNEDGKFIPGYRNTLWLFQKVRIWNGWRRNGIDNFFCRGVYVITELQTINEGGANIYVNLTLSDKFALLDGSGLSGILPNAYVIPVGTYIHAAIKAVLTAAGEVKSPIISCENIQTYFTITKDVGDSYASILEDLASMTSSDVFFDRNGYLRFQSPTINELTGVSSKPSVFDFTTDDIYYISGNHRYQFNSVKNYIVVRSSNIQGNTIQAIAEDNNIFSPYRVSLIGERILVIENSNAYTQELCQQFANWALWKNAIVNESIDITCVPVDSIEEGNIITIMDNSIGTDRDRYLVNSINFPLLNNGTSSINCWKIRSLE